MPLERAERGGVVLDMKSQFTRLAYPRVRIVSGPVRAQPRRSPSYLVPWAVATRLLRRTAQPRVRYLVRPPQ